jgi:hypothetical protein
VVPAAEMSDHRVDTQLHGLAVRVPPMAEHA